MSQGEWGEHMAYGRVPSVCHLVWSESPICRLATASQAQFVGLPVR